LAAVAVVAEVVAVAVVLAVLTAMFVATLAVEAAASKVALAAGEVLRLAVMEVAMEEPQLAATLLAAVPTEVEPVAMVVAATATHLAQPATLGGKYYETRHRDTQDIISFFVRRPGMPCRADLDSDFSFPSFSKFHFSMVFCDLLP
jgi:hypothetical protein